MTVNWVVELDQINQIVMIRVESRIHALGSSSSSPHFFYHESLPKVLKVSDYQWRLAPGYQHF